MHRMRWRSGAPRFLQIASDGAIGYSTAADGEAMLCRARLSLQSEGFKDNVKGGYSHKGAEPPSRITARPQRLAFPNRYVAKSRDSSRPDQPPPLPR
jgi:hypothetical protein